MHDLGQRASLKRWQLGVILLLVFATTGASIALGIITYGTQTKLLRVQTEQSKTQDELVKAQSRQTALVIALQQNRIQSIADLCRRDNRDNGRNILFVQALGNKPSVIRLARRIYRINPDCQAYARSIVRLKPKP